MMTVHHLIAPSVAQDSAKRGTSSVPRFAVLLRFAPVVATLLIMSAATGDPAPGDAWIGRALQHVPLGWLPANVAVFLARPSVLFVAWCVGAVAALRSRNWRLVAAAVLVLIALSVNPILKELFARPRPGAHELIIRRAADGFGFPSGHTSSATLMYGYAALALASVAPPRMARLCIGAASAAIGLIAFERVYAGAHWPSDVAGGFISGALLVAGCVTLGGLIVSRMLGHRRSSALTPAAQPVIAPRPVHTRTFTDAVERIP